MIIVRCAVFQSVLGAVVGVAGVHRSDDSQCVQCQVRRTVCRVVGGTLHRR